MTDNESININLDEIEYNILESLNPQWMLWNIDANHPVEISQFSKLIGFFRKNETYTIDIDQLKDMGIYPVRSSMLKKLIKAGYANLAQNTLEFKKKEINKGNIESYLRNLNLVYSDIIKSAKKEKTIFPTSHFCVIDKSLYIPVHLKDIGSRKVKNSNRPLLEIIFPDNILPSILIPTSKLDAINTMCTSKIIYELGKQAAENSDFFTKRIEVDKKKMSIQYPRLFDIDIQRINKKTNRDYRENYTAMVMEKMFSNNNLIKMFLNEFDSEINSEILRIFPYTSASSYSYLQSFEILREIYLNQETNEKVKLTEIYGLVYDNLKYFVYESEIKQHLEKEIPDLDSDYFTELMEQFAEEYIYKKNRYGISQIITFRIVNDANIEEDIYLHFHNLNKYLTSGFDRITSRFQKGIQNKWETLLRNHELEMEMFERNLFVETIFNYIQDHDPILMQVLNRQILYRMLEGIENLSTPVTRLRLYGKEEIDRVIGLSNEALYRKAYRNIVEHQNVAARFVFVFVNWVVKSIFNYNKKKNREEYKSRKKEIAKEKEEIAKKKQEDLDKKKDIFYSSIEISGKDELKNRCDQSWQRVPSSLSRDQLEKNILSDLNAFFKNKDEVKVYALQYLVDKNLKRVLSKAPHLNGYSGFIEEFIKFRTYLYVAESTTLRSKITAKI
jgi:hypothetical protein